MSSPSLVLDETYIGKLCVATNTLEALWVPALAHGTYDSSNDEFT